MKLTLADTASGYDLTSLNNNFSLIEAEFQDKVLYRDNPTGEPNQMEQELDMNSYTIYNIPDATEGTQVVPLSQLQRSINAASSGLIARLRETRKIASDGQTVFNLSDITYTPGVNNLQVYVNGVAQIPGVDYSETSSTVITFLTGLEPGDAVDVYTNESTTNITDPVAQQKLEKRVIRVSSRTEMKGYDVPAGTQFSLEEGGRSGSFVVKSGTPPSDPQEGIYVVLNNSNYVERVQKHPVYFGWFGAALDGTTDDTDAISAACDYVQSVGGGVLTNQGKNSGFTPTKGAAEANWIYEFSGLSKLHIVGGGTFVDLTSSYSTSEYSGLFKITDCDNINLDFKVQTQNQVTDSTLPVEGGLNAVQLEGGCNGVNLNLYGQGGRELFRCLGVAGASTENTVRGVRGYIKATGTHYPFQCNFSGNDVDIVLDAETVGRAYFVYGASNVKIKARTKNLRKTPKIAAFEGQGVNDVTVFHYDRDTDSSQIAINLCEVAFSDETAATIQDLTLHIDAKRTNTTGWGNTISVSKFLAGGSPDTTGRGHQLINFRLSGVSDMTGTTNNHLVVGSGSFVNGSDIVSGFSAKDLKLYGAGSNLSCGFSLACVDSPYYENVRSEGSIYPFTTNDVEAVFFSCVANAFSNGSGDASKCFYDNCVISGPFSSSSIDEFKTFKNCEFLGERFDQETYGGRGTSTAGNFLLGDLTPSRTVFKVRASSSGMFRLKYHLCSDILDASSGTRSETFGIKTFSAVVNSSGVWTIQQAASDETTERTQNTASAITISLIDGDSDGAFIEVSCTNYNGANARGSFVLEHLSLYEVGAVYPSL